MDKQTVIKWLNEHHRGDRQWLADQCGKSINTIYTWFSHRPIPRDAQLTIQRLMASDEERQRIDSVVPQNLVLEFTRADFDAICDRAIEARKRPNQWAEEQLRALAYEDMDELADRIQAPEASGTYNGSKPNAEDKPA